MEQHHWKQPDKQGKYRSTTADHQQQQANHSHKNQFIASPPSNNSSHLQHHRSNHHNSNKQQVDPIKSIANVLNQHSKFVQQQQQQSQEHNKLDQSRNHSIVGRDIGALSSGNINNSVAPPTQATFSQSSNQVDQGNSYLYAYNDFITYTATRALQEQQQQQQQSQVRPAIPESAEDLRNHNRLIQQQHLKHQESLIDSEEDDALSYILHQHRLQAAHESHLQQNPQAASYRHLDGAGHLNPCFQQDQINLEQDNFLEAHRIDHHLSCSRSSHPRHICGIGGSQNDNLNHIAARLREESQKAFALNQKSRNTNNQSQNYLQTPTADELALQSFTQDLTAIQDQLATVVNPLAYHEPLDEANADASYLDLNLNNEHLSRSVAKKTGSETESGGVAPSTRGGAASLHLGILSDSGRHEEDDVEIVTSESNSNSNSNSDLSRPTTTLTASHAVLTRPLSSSNNNNRRRRSSEPSAGYLSWLFCCLCNLIGSNSASNHQTTIKHQQHYGSNILNAAKTRGNKRRKKAKHRSTLHATNEASIIQTMYTNSQQQQLGDALGQLGGQAGAYYPTPTGGGGGSSSTTSTPGHLHHHQHYSNHQHQHQLPHHNHHHHHYPLSSDSSLSSSAFANSALRMNAFFKSCCSKKCLFVSCLMLILLIFIFVIGLSAYLNFLINLNKTNLTPVSGRLRVESQGDTYSDQLANRTSKDFLAKQQQYETILRGAFDRNQQQNLLKTYPNHLVKLEVYNFKPGSLWVYFRLFINKRTLMQDTQLMKRKSPDEHLDRQFLPRLTQQTLHSGFEQLVAAHSSTRNKLQSGGPDLLRQPRLATATEKLLKNVPGTQQKLDNNVKSFDEQISRLMPIIESIDLQSIMVTPEFDMLQSIAAQQQQQQQQSMSDNLRASQFLTTSSSTVMVASGTDKSLATEYDIGAPSSTATGPRDTLPSPNNTTLFPSITRPTLQPEPVDVTGSSDEVNVSTKKFTLYGYKENTTRPTTSSRPRTGASAGGSGSSRPQEYESPFLVNQIQKPQAPGRQFATAPSASNNSPLEASESSTFRPVRTQELISMTKPTEQQQQQRRQFEQPAGGREQQMVKQQLAANGQLHQLNNNFNNKTTLFAQFQPTVGANATLLEVSNPTAAKNLGSGGPALQKSGSSVVALGKGANETVAFPSQPMIAPYQKIDFSTTSAAVDSSTSSSGASSSSSSPTTNIEDLWDKALSQSLRKNSTFAKIDSSSSSSPPPQSSSSRQLDSGNDQQAPKRLITITTTGATRNPSQNFSNNNDWHKIQVLSSDISDTIRAQLQNASFASTTLSPITLTNGPQLKPKISPHLKQGGSLISITLKQPDSSAAGVEQTNATRLTQIKTDKRPSASFDNQRVPLIAANDQLKRNTTSKPIIKQQLVAANKLKKVSGEVSSSPVRVANGTLNNSAKGIRIVDNFLASLDSGNRTVTQWLNGTVNLHQRNKTQETFNYNAEHFAPTQPTTIELTRSTTSSPPLRTTAHSRQHNANSVDYTTTSSAPQRYLASSTSSSAPATEGPFKVVTPQTVMRSNVYQQPAARSQNGTPSTNFSNQWRPISSNNNNNNNQTGQRRPPIVATTNTNNMPSNSGSQSPFAMSPSILDTNPNDKLTLTPGRRPSNKLSNTYQIVGAASSNNEFESHRMSRMRHQTTEQNPSTVSSLASTSTSSESASRSVDDFIATSTTTEKVEGMRSSTLLPPVFLNSLRNNEQPIPVASQSLVNSLDLAPKRTRGPFAFATLMSAVPPIVSESPINMFNSADQLPPGQRSERSSDRQLIRKKLILDDRDQEQSDRPASVQNETDIEHFGSRAQPVAKNQLDLVRDESSDVVAQGNSFKCRYYGCRAKGSSKFICLNYTQICDDHIQCDDESDELDCVSLLKHDSKTNRLSFSNGGGIIYLNRKGSLAPMCIDYFAQTSDNRLNTGHDSPTVQVAQAEAAKKQQELIKQINTIGQYACSLQSFSRLVSVKINHHDLVDGLNFIKNAKLYHRLSIVDASDKSQEERSDHDSFKSGTSEHEVEVSTSTNCPSQRTVFVKCGDFECGQDSFSVIDSTGDAANSAKRKDGVIINDFPWLVKLYWLGSLSCHGYLIDEMWMITSNECFANKSLLTDDLNGWTAEISYEHYGNDDYQSIESNRRSIKEIIMQPNDGGSFPYQGPAIVLAKLEKPVRFSPLNRPICLPLSLMNKTTAIHRLYKDCVSVALPLATGPPTHDLILSKVELHKTSDCLSGTIGADLQKSGNLICVSELASRSDSSEAVAEAAGSSQVKEGDATRVLICPSSQANRSRSKWTIVGVQNKPRESPLESNKQLFTTVSSQLEWIVDTMNPKAYPNPNLEGATTDPNGNELHLMSTLTSINQTCNRFRCSSGECVEWSRICDSSFDCASKEDEKDCYK